MPATGHLWVDVAVLQYCSHLVYLVLRFATHKWKPVRQWLTICSVSEGNVLINKKYLKKIKNWHKPCKVRSVRRQI
ncbi:hypothetical protein FK516_02905 [Klebsiella pneumoniae]|nr:hypothetical protein [Klebsiella pneumoniae]HBX8053372.1 hypothetical protein [Klebsiella pneumoniae]HBY2508757.1 hypothetical protein [Klebsiella pneumoniae]HBZ2547155.1 hypothetical protein [Klebsiella pneumoniae]HBZ4133882.1 hypothetical protein [Klebsiella pneumoniae]